MSEMYRELCRCAGEANVREDEPMSGHTTFRVGGPAALFVEPDGPESLREVVRACRKAAYPYFILGNGSNLLVGDRGYEGAVISMGKGFGGCRMDGDRILAQAGALNSRIAKESLAMSLTGYEFAAGIPGTLGGAVVMNAGAYGGEMREILGKIKVLTPDGDLLDTTKEELHMGYRYSDIPHLGYIVLEAELLLRQGEQERIREQMDLLMEKRREKQPLEYASAGSTFKRPKDHFAGRLIEDAGLRGFLVGGAQVSEKHCGFVINRGDATASDIMELCRAVQAKVKTAFGVELEMEVKTLGSF